MQTPLAPPRPPTTLNKQSRCGSKIMASIIGEMLQGACQKKMFTLTRHLRARAATDASSPMILSVCISDHLLRRIRGETCFGFGMSGFTASWRRVRWSLSQLPSARICRLYGVLKMAPSRLHKKTLLFRRAFEGNNKAFERCGSHPKCQAQEMLLFALCCAIRKFYFLFRPHWLLGQQVHLCSFSFRTHQVAVFAFQSPPFAQP